MATTLYYANQYFTTTLSVAGGIDASQTTGIVLSSVSGIDTTKPGIACLEWADPLGTNREWITYTSVNSTTKTLQGVARGGEGDSGTGKVHSNGVAVAFPISESHINNLATALSIGGSATNGLEGVLDEDDFVTNSATKVPTQQSAKAYVASQILDEDDFASDSATKAPTQQSAKAYITAAIAAVSTTLRSKIIYATRDMTAASGDVAYTGVGFQPSSIICAASQDSTATFSFGFADKNKTNYIVQGLTNSATGSSVQEYLLSIQPTGGNAQTAIVKSYDADGFTLTWTKISSPTGTGKIAFLCFK